MNKISTVVVDDEFFNRGLITMLINRFGPEYEIVGEAESVSEGYKLISRLKPRVVFLDIKMPDGSGFDLLKKFDSFDFEVVFITGFDTYVLQAFEYNALDYILKPVDLDKFKQTVERVSQRLNTSTSAGEAAMKIPLHYDEKVVLLSISEIQYMVGDAQGTRFFRDKSETFNSAKNLADLLPLFSGFEDFMQVNEFTCVNLNFAAGFNKTGRLLTMTDGKVTQVSEAQQEKLLKFLAQRKSGLL